MGERRYRAEGRRPFEGRADNIGETPTRPVIDIVISPLLEPRRKAFPAQARRATAMVEPRGHHRTATRLAGRRGHEAAARGTNRTMAVHHGVRARDGFALRTRCRRAAVRLDSAICWRINVC